MRHVRASDVGSLARTVARWAGPASNVFAGRLRSSLFGVSAADYGLWVDGERLPPRQMTVRDVEEALLRPYLRKELLPPPSLLFASACGARVGAHDLCRDIWRRQGKQEFAPLPDFCSPDCPDCSVILDQHEESPPKPKDPTSLEMMTAHGKIKVMPHPMCPENQILFLSGTKVTAVRLGSSDSVTETLTDGLRAESLDGRIATASTLGLRAYARLNEEWAMRRTYSAPTPRPRDPASERAATLRYRLDRKLARARARP